MEYKLTFEDGSSAYLLHYGVSGMQWGVWSPETISKYKVGNGGSVSKTWKESGKKTSSKGSKTSKKDSGSSNESKKKIETVYDEGKKWKLKEVEGHKGYYYRDGLVEDSKKKKSAGKLAVDGIWGPKTQKALEKQLGLSADGKKDAATTRKLQDILGVKATGKMDKVTASALRNALGTSKKGSEAVKVLQKALNAKKIQNNR